MFRNYLKIAVRNLFRQKSFSVINILGLAIGLASSILILLWVRYELSYDKFHTDHEQLFRITCQVEDVQAAIAPAPLAPAMSQQMPEVTDGLRTSLIRTHLFQVDNQKYEEKTVLFADSNFFQFFSFPLSEGDRKTVLNQPQSIVISEKIATKYFGTSDPVGRTMQIDNGDDLLITGILAKSSLPSHLPFDFLIPMSYLARSEADIRENRWDNFNYYSYVKLTESSAASTVGRSAVSAKTDRLYQENEDQLKVRFSLQPLKDIHLRSHFLGDVPGHGNIQYVYIFLFTALFIVVIACINFMNLSTARSARRAREVGFRKVAGADRKQLIIQFLAESCLVSCIALVIAAGIILLALPAFNLVSGQQIGLDVFNWQLILGIFGFTLCIGLLAGSYPAFYLSGFKPVQVLSMQNNPGGGHQFFRNILVVTQFVFSIILIIGTIVVHQQQQFIREQNLGFDKKNLIYVSLRGKLRQNQDALRSALEKNNFTTKFTFIDELPTDLLSGTIDVNWDGKNPNAQFIFSKMDADDHFVEVFDVQMRSGSAFLREYTTEEKTYMLNEKAVQVMGMNPDEIVGKEFTLWGDKGPVVGVVNDFHFKPIQQPIEPLVIRYNKRGGIVVVRTQPNAIESTIMALKEINQKLDPEYPFEYGFVDQDLDKLYQAEQRLGKLVRIFALLAIFISCLGLFGLSAYLAERRKKEISVRKVLGASVSNVVYLLARDFTKPIWIAMIIATPIAFIVVNKWLENFSYHVELKWWVLLISCLAAWSIALLTVSFETIRAAVAHPVDALQN